MCIVPIRSHFLISWVVLHVRKLIELVMVEASLH